MTRQWRWTIALLIPWCPAAADPKWILMRTEHFEAYSSAGERATRQTLKHFEQVRGIFGPMMPARKAQEEVVRIVIFGSKKEFDPYRLNDFAVAYYQGGAQRDCIVLSSAATQVFPVAVHEYVHLVANHSGLRLPPWLGEGLAELYSTLKPQGKQVLVGELIPGRREALAQSRWVPLGELLAADHSSALYNEKDKAGSLYNEGWALTHMLALSAAYRRNFGDTVSAISGGEDSGRALERIYGKPLAKIEDDLQNYLNGILFQGVLLPALAEKSAAPVAAVPVEGVDLELVLLDLHVPPEREQEVRRRLARLAAEAPHRPEPFARLGYDALRRGKPGEAQQHFGKAFDLGTKNPRLLWDYGRMAAGESAARGSQVLERLLEVEPGRTEARVELAALYVMQRRATDALKSLQPVKAVSPEVAPRFFKVLAFALAESGNREEAAKAARRMLAQARSPAEKNEAESLLRSLERAGAAPPPMAAMEEAGGGERPALSRPDAPGRSPVPSAPLRTAAEPVPELGTAKGRFVELQCEGGGAKMWLESAPGRTAYLIDDPGQVTVVGVAGGKVDMTCGPQKGLPVSVEYDPAGAAPGVAGRLKVLDFRALN